jgi:hypothetical protein
MFSFVFLVFYTSLLAQPIVKKELTQFLFSDFLPADIKMKTGPDITLDLNYNTVTGKIVFKMGGNLYDMVNPKSVDTVYLQQCVFVPSDTVFAEVISKGAIAFFIKHSSYVSMRRKPEMKGTAQVSTSNFYAEGNSTTVNLNQKLPSGFVVRPSNILLVRVDDKLTEFTNARQLLKVFPDYADQIKFFIKESHLKPDNKPDLIRIGIYCNDLIKQD